MQENIISVGELTGFIKNLLEDNFQGIFITGEISNFKRHSSGHRYFSLKDNSAQISCTMWKHRTLDFVPEDGMKVIVEGNLTVYPPRGNYQLDIYDMKPAGKGDLYLAFEALKKELEESGYFAPELKKTIPNMPLKIGVATSPTGAAIRDILSTMQRRMPAAEILFRPTIVQGDNSGRDIANAINELDRLNPDLIIAGRGGGSIEDLWGFNTREAADSFFNCSAPIISAVGHETDFTITDFVADVRAATPTAAAEIASRITKDDLTDKIANYEDNMYNFLIDYIDRKRDNLDNLFRENIKNKITDKINYFNQFNDDSIYKITKEINYRFERSKTKNQSLTSHLMSLNPEAPFDKGYALIKVGYDYLNSDDSLAKYKKVEIVRKNENAAARITGILPQSLF
jgi:exodeoxyribonuclease VII large subunit